MHVNNTYLGESTIVPDVTLMGEAVADKSKLALLGVLLDGVVSIFLADLYVPMISLSLWYRTKHLLSSFLTSNLALVQRGISTIMLKTLFSSLAKRGTSWKAETGTPSFSIIRFLIRYSNLYSLHLEQMHAHPYNARSMNPFHTYQ